MITLYSDPKIQYITNPSNIELGLYKQSYTKRINYKTVQ